MGIILDSPNRKLRAGFILLVSVYCLYAFYHSYRLPQLNIKNHAKTLRIKQSQELHSNWKQRGVPFHPNHTPALPSSSTVRQQLAYQFPYEPHKGFQNNIWQTWKVALDDDTFPRRYGQFQKSWTDINKGYKHYVLSDDQCHELIRLLYGPVPDVVEAYDSLPKSILKADYFRYLILFARGGVYSDIDTVVLKPIMTWLLMNETLYGQPNTAGLVVGIEADPDRPDWNDWYARRIQFCQWTIQAKKGHPMLGELIARIADHTLERKRKGQLKKVLGNDEGGDIMNWTGPGIFTDTVFDYMNNVLQPETNFKVHEYEELVSWKTFTGMQMPIGVDDVLVLPITSFSPNVGHMGSKPLSDPMAYVDHRFLGSWKDDKKKNK